MGIDLTTAGQNPSISISLFAKLACFHEADLNRNRHLFHFRRWKIRWINLIRCRLHRCGACPSKRSSRPRHLGFRIWPHFPQVERLSILARWEKGWTHACLNLINFDPGFPWKGTHRTYQALEQVFCGKLLRDEHSFSVHYNHRIQFYEESICGLVEMQGLSSQMHDAWFCNL